MEPARLRRNYVNGPFGQIHVRMAGSSRAGRRPLMCFHISPLSGAVFETWLGEMGKDRLTVAPDTPGFGMSDPPSEPPSIKDYAEAMAEVLDDLDVNEVDLMGYHTGSKIAVELARRRHRMVKHVVLIAAPVYTAEELEAAQQRVKNAPSGAADDGSHLTAQWQGFQKFRGPGQTAETLMKHFPEAIRTGAHRAWGHAAAFAYKHEENIGEVKAPVLVLNPNDEVKHLTPRVLPHLKEGRLLDLPEWGHGMVDLRASELAHIIRPFLDDDVWPAGARVA